MASPHTLSAPTMQPARSSPQPVSPTASPILLAKPRALSASTASGSGSGGSSSSSSRQAAHAEGTSPAPSMGKLQTTYRALQVRARSSWLDLRSGSKRSGASGSGAGAESAVPLPPSSSREMLAAPSAPSHLVAAGTAPRPDAARRRSSGAALELSAEPTQEMLEQRRGSAGTLKASRWSILPRSRPPSRPSSSGSGAGASSSSWGRRRRDAPRIASDLAATSMGPSPSSHEHPLPPPLASSAGPKDIASFASYAFPGAEPQGAAAAAPALLAPQWMPHENPAHATSATPVVAHYTTLLHAPKRGALNPLSGPPRRASEAPPCTCATATPRRHSELPVVLPRVVPSPPVSRSASGQGAPPQTFAATSTLYPRRSVRASANRARLVTQLASWDFCSLDLNEEELRTACVMLFDTALNAPLPRSLLAPDEPPGSKGEEMTTMAAFLDIAPEAVRRLVDGIAELYHSSNAYHNVHHATDVLQALYVLLADLGALPKLVATGHSEWDARHSPVAPLDALALLFAAIGHDAGHPGLSNAYLGNAEAPIATAFRCAAPHHDASASSASSPAAASPAARAPEGSPLESYHVLLLEGLLERCGLSQLTWAASGSRSELGSLIRTCVLATDMAIHARFVEELEAFERRLYGDDGAPSTPAERAALIRARPREERTLLCSALLKCADVSNPVRVRSIGRRWSLALRREWERQSALEAECGLPATVGGGAVACKHKHGPHKTHAGTAPLPNATTGDEEGLRRTSAAQMVAQIGGGGGAAADSAELSVDALVAAGELHEERSLARGQVAFVRFFVTPLLDTLARIVPELQPYAATACENSVLWGKRLEQLDAVHSALELCATEEPPDEAAVALEEASRLHRGGFPAVLTILAAERLRLPAIFLPPLPGAAPDAVAARLMVQHTLEDALASATRNWAAPLCEVISSVPSTPLVPCSSMASSRAVRPGIAASSVEADDRARTASSDSAVSSLGSLASTPATAASSSTVATSSASAVGGGGGGVPLPKSNGALQHGGTDAELGAAALGSLPPISASSSSVSHAASTMEPPTKLQASPTKPKRKPIDRMRRFIAGK